MKKSDSEISRHASCHTDTCHILAQAFLESHNSVIKLDLQTGKALVLKSGLDGEIDGMVFDWPDLLEYYANRHVYPPDRECLHSFHPELIKQLCQGKNSCKCMELRCMSETDQYEWFELYAYKVGADEHTFLICTKNINEAKLVRSIVDLFVYRNYDYLFLINTKNDSYTRFTANKENIPVPPEKGAHYTEDMIRYNRIYVAPEDFERVTANMQIPHVLKMLAQSDSYSFTSGGITNDGKYRRSQVLFLFYDKTAGLILLARTDVTQIYLEEQEKSRQLHEALVSAQLDAMTGIFNQKATTELIKRSLESQYRKMAAFLFIDVDNFKQVNDTLGHQTGDRLLCFLAKRLEEIAGRNGIAGRLGGDEFLLYLSDISSIRKIEEIARSICDIPSTLSEVSILQGMISCSVGISIYPHDGTDYEKLLGKADQALYTSKRYGKREYYFYSLEAEPLTDQMSPLALEKSRFVKE